MRKITERQALYVRVLLKECFGNIYKNVLKVEYGVTKVEDLFFKDACFLIEKLKKENRDKVFIVRIKEKVMESLGQQKLFY